LGSVSSLVSEKKIFEISANQSILLALAAMLNIRLERKTKTLCSIIVFLVHLDQSSSELLPSLGVHRLLSVVFSHFKLLLRNHWANWNQA
jgi:ABC-type glucose/galactose transport system permease subunit